MNLVIKVGHYSVVICSKNRVWRGGFYIRLADIGFGFGNKRSMKAFSMLLELFLI